jgi:hypothetical protein
MKTKKNSRINLQIDEYKREIDNIATNTSQGKRQL